MANIILSKYFNQKTLSLIEQMPGYFLWKDLNSVYLVGSSSTAKIFGFNDTDQLTGITDSTVRCEAAEYAELFIKQDEKVKIGGNPISVLDVHPYANNEIKTLIINKSLLLDKNSKPIGINCHCIEVNNQILSDIALQLAKSDKTITNNKHIKKAANFYLNSQYDGLNLSKRQTECLFYLIRGKSLKAIGKAMNLSPRTIESYIDLIKDKMGCNTKSEVIEKAIEIGYLEILPKEVISNNLKTLLMTID